MGLFIWIYLELPASHAKRIVLSFFYENAQLTNLGCCHETSTKDPFWYKIFKKKFLASPCRFSARVSWSSEWFDWRILCILFPSPACVFDIGTQGSVSEATQTQLNGTDYSNRGSRPSNLSRNRMEENRRPGRLIKAGSVDRIFIMRCASSAFKLSGATITKN
jgi:hypothetical protein